MGQRDELKACLKPSQRAAEGLKNGLAAIFLTEGLGGGHSAQMGMGGVQKMPLAGQSVAVRAESVKLFLDGEPINGVQARDAFPANPKAFQFHGLSPGTADIAGRLSGSGCQVVHDHMFGPRGNCAR